MVTFEPPTPYVQPTPRRIRVRLGDRVVADSSHAQLVVQFGPHGFPTYFVPFEDVRPGVLVDESDGGWSVVAGGRRADAGGRGCGQLAERRGHSTFSRWT